MRSSIHIGDRFGHLTIIDKDKRPQHNASWLCRCDCGKEIYTCTSRLLSGKHRSCGCTDHTKRNNTADLTGKQIGHLTVISHSPNPRRKSSWLCSCACGNTIELPASVILTGKKTSCGCVHHSAKHPSKDLTLYNPKLISKSYTSFNLGKKNPLKFFIKMPPIIPATFP